MNALKHPILLALALTCPLFGARPAHAGNWPQWRGPYFNGSTTETNLPATWDKTNRVAWVAPMPGYSGATPVVWNDQVFVSSTDAQKNLLLLCLNSRDGKLRWRQPVAVGDRSSGRNNMASPSPATDGRSVFILFGTGDLAAIDFDGKTLWSRNLAKDFGRFSIMWLYGSSPLLYRDRLYVQVLQREVPDEYPHALDNRPQRDSYLLCIDARTGKDLWRHVRDTDAIKEAHEAYSTPIPVDSGGQSEIIVAGGNYVTGHDPETGIEFWRCGGLNTRNEPWWRLVTSPVVADGLIIASAPRGDPVLAIRRGGKGLITDTHLAWKFTEAPTDCATPLYYGGKLFVLDGDKQIMTCLDPKTGEKVWQGNVGVRDIFRASPTGADGKIYCVSERGTVVVLEAGTGFKILSTIQMGEEPCRASIPVAGGRLFIRTAENLYCIGNAR